MSLVDALLLDPALFDVWIAYRTDGIKGSGTAADPWNGSPKLGTPVNLTSASRSGTEATVILAAGHGLQNGDVVIVAGETSEPLLWNGTFTVRNVKGVSSERGQVPKGVKFRKGSVPSSITA